MPSPGSYALVLDATLATDRCAARFSRVLIDGGSSINILYRDTLEKLISQLLCVGFGCHPCNG